MHSFFINLYGENNSFARNVKNENFKNIYIKRKSNSKKKNRASDFIVEVLSSVKEEITFISPLYFMMLSFLYIYIKTDKQETPPFFKNTIFLNFAHKISLASPFFFQQEPVDSIRNEDPTNYGVRNSPKSIEEALKQKTFGITAHYYCNAIESLFPGDSLALFYKKMSGFGRSQNIIKIRKEKKKNEFEKNETLKLLFWFIKHPISEIAWNEFR